MKCPLGPQKQSLSSDLAKKARVERRSQSPPRIKSPVKDSQKRDPFSRFAVFKNMIVFHDHLSNIAKHMKTLSKIGRGGSHFRQVKRVSYLALHISVSRDDTRPMRPLRPAPAVLVGQKLDPGHQKSNFSVGTSAPGPRSCQSGVETAPNRRRTGAGSAPDRRWIGAESAPDRRRIGAGSAPN